MDWTGKMHVINSSVVLLLCNFVTTPL